jgi:general secretion pathway protein G
MDPRSSEAAGPRRTAAGFTLIELLIVVAMVGILAAVAVGQYQKNILRAREVVLKENLFVMRSSIQMYFADKGRYPSDLQALVDDHYLARMPVDPITESEDTWITEYAELSDMDITTEPGIADVRSGASGVGMDGTSYAEW